MAAAIIARQRSDGLIASTLQRIAIPSQHRDRSAIPSARVKGGSHRVPHQLLASLVISILFCASLRNQSGMPRLFGRLRVVKEKPYSTSPASASGATTAPAELLERRILAPAEAPDMALSGLLRDTKVNTPDVPRRIINAFAR